MKNKINLVESINLKKLEDLKLPLAVAFSGGADSTALLYLCKKYFPNDTCAIHINHNLQKSAIDFENHCKKVCENLKIPLEIIKIDAKNKIGESPEDSARKHRYLALTNFALEKSIKSIFLAQHLDDQIETLILALTRGSGVAGLSAMPKFWQKNDLNWFRPFLNISSLEIKNWLNEQNIFWIDDPTNSDLNFTRNKIRHKLIPTLAENFPKFRETFSRSCENLAQSLELQNEIAIFDLKEIENPLKIKKLQNLSKARQINCLRFWLKNYYQTTPTNSQINELIKQIEACKTRGHKIYLKIGSGFIVRNLDFLNWYNS